MCITFSSCIRNVTYNYYKNVTYLKQPKSMCERNFPKMLAKNHRLIYS